MGYDKFATRDGDEIVVTCDSIDTISPYSKFALSRDQDFVDTAKHMDVLDGVKANNVKRLGYAYQHDTVIKMVKRRRCLCALTMGLGKTMVSIGALSYYHNDDSISLIVCPSYLCDNWKKELSFWWSDVEFCTVPSAKKFTSWDDHKGKVTVVSYEIASSIIKKYGTPIDNIILDESHYIKNVKSQRFKKLHVCIRSSRQLFLLTGTPRPNRNEELFAQLHLLYPGVFSEYLVFCRRYCDLKENRWGRIDVGGSSNTLELQFLLSKLCIRLRREDVLDDLPKFRRDKFIISAKVSSNFQKLRDDFVSIIKTSANKDVEFDLKSKIAEMYRLTADVKKPYVLEYIKDNVVGDEKREKIIIFTKHRHMMEDIYALFTPADCIWVDGSLTQKERTKRIDSFLSSDEGSPYTAVLTLGSCSTGLNLVPVSNMIFVEMDWSPSILLQAECRINRIGGASHLNYTYLLCSGTLDDMIFRKNFEKAVTSEMLIDGSSYGDLEMDSVVAVDGYDQEDNKRQKIE